MSESSSPEVMTISHEDELVRQVEELLEPGDIDLTGIIVDTEFTSDDEIDLHQATVAIGELIADAAGVDEWYVYSGNDDSSFASNQHQGLQLADDAFLWECQHLLRSDTFEIVMYYESSIHHEDLVRSVRDAGYHVIPVDSPDQ